MVSGLDTRAGAIRGAPGVRNGGNVSLSNREVLTLSGKGRSRVFPHDKVSVADRGLGRPDASDRTGGRLAWDLVWVAVGAVYTWKAFHYGGSPGAFPRLVGTALLVFALVDTGRTARSFHLRRGKAPTERDRRRQRSNVWRSLSVVVLCVLFVTAWNLLGAAVDVVVFMLGGAVLMGARRTRQLGATVLVAFACIAFFLVLAHFGGGHGLPRGVLPKVGGL